MKELDEEEKEEAREAEVHETVNSAFYLTQWGWENDDKSNPTAPTADHEEHSREGGSLVTMKNINLTLEGWFSPVSKLIFGSKYWVHIPGPHRFSRKIPEKHKT